MRIWFPSYCWVGSLAATYYSKSGSFSIFITSLLGIIPGSLHCVIQRKKIVLKNKKYVGNETAGDKSFHSIGPISTIYGTLMPQIHTHVYALVQKSSDGPVTYLP